jgi:cell division protein FtsB
VFRKLLDRIPARLRNRYGLAAAFFAAWMGIFSDNDLWTLWKNKRELSRMREQSAWYAREIARTKEQLAEINSDTELLEKFARERYLMKRDNEDIFVLVASKD